MEQTNSRWLYIFLLMSLISIMLFPPKVHASSNWLKYFRKDSLLNTYKRSYAVLDDTLWIGTHGDGVNIKDGEKTISYTNRNTRSTPALDDGLISDYITCITIDEKNGRVWIGTNAGLSSCNLAGKEWQRYTDKTGLPNSVIRDVAIDSAGNLWVGTPSGIAIYDGAAWKTVTDRQGLAQNSVHSIKVKGDAVWVGTVGGTISRYRDGKWRTFVSFE